MSIAEKEQFTQSATKAGISVSHDELREYAANVRRYGEEAMGMTSDLISSAGNVKNSWEPVQDVMQSLQGYTNKIGVNIREMGAATAAAAAQARFLGSDYKSVLNISKQLMSEKSQEGLAKMGITNKDYGSVMNQLATGRHGMTDAMKIFFAQKQGIGGSVSEKLREMDMGAGGEITGKYLNSVSQMIKGFKGEDRYLAAKQMWKQGFMGNIDEKSFRTIFKGMEDNTDWTSKAGQEKIVEATESTNAILHSMRSMGATTEKLQEGMSKMIMGIFKTIVNFPQNIAANLAAMMPGASSKAEERAKRYNNFMKYQTQQVTQGFDFITGAVKEGAEGGGSFIFDDDTDTTDYGKLLKKEKNKGKNKKGGKQIPPKSAVIDNKESSKYANRYDTAGGPHSQNVHITGEIILTDEQKRRFGHATIQRAEVGS
jgi:hypothetical protein